MRNRTDTRSLGRPPIGGVPAGNLSMTVASSPLALRTGSARLHRHPVLQPTDQVIRKRDFLLDPYLLRRTRTAAHTAQRRQMNTPGVLPSSATAARGRPRPQHPHITSSAGWTARRSSGFTGGPPAAFRPWVTRPRPSSVRYNWHANPTGRPDLRTDPGHPPAPSGTPGTAPPPPPPASKPGHALPRHGGWLMATSAAHATARPRRASSDSDRSTAGKWPCRS